MTNTVEVFTLGSTYNCRQVKCFVMHHPPQHHCRPLPPTPAGYCPPHKKYPWGKAKGKCETTSKLPISQPKWHSWDATQQWPHPLEWLDLRLCHYISSPFNSGKPFLLVASTGTSSQTRLQNRGMSVWRWQALSALCERVCQRAECHWCWFIRKE